LSLLILERALCAVQLETVESEIESLVKKVEAGGDTSNIKSLASGVEQQLSALKAIVGFD
jgi:hypothetical protein